MCSKLLRVIELQLLACERSSLMVLSTVSWDKSFWAIVAQSLKLRSVVHLNHDSIDAISALIHSEINEALYHVGINAVPYRPVLA